MICVGRYQLCWGGASVALIGPRWSLLLKSPWARAYFSERRGLRLPLARLWGWRLFFTRQEEVARHPERFAPRD